MVPPPITLNKSMMYHFITSGSCTLLPLAIHRAGEPHQAGFFQEDKGV
jgi:hypothetical protein